MDLRSEIKDETLVAQIATDYTTAQLDPPIRALLDYARKLTTTPHAASADDIATLRAHGFSDEAIHDAVQVIAYFNYINRVADGLGIELDEGLQRV